MSGLERQMLVGLVKREGLKAIVKMLRVERDHLARMEGVDNFHGKKDKYIATLKKQSSVLFDAVLRLKEIEDDNCKTETPLRPDPEPIPSP